MFSNVKKTSVKTHTPVCWHKYWFFEGSKDYVRLSNRYSLRVGLACAVFELNKNTYEIRLALFDFIRIHDNNDAHSAITKHVCYTVNVPVETQSFLFSREIVRKLPFCVK